MNSELASHPRLERLLAEVLRYGTWLSSSVIALGLVLAFAEGTAGTHHWAPVSGTAVITAGIALLIMLPVFRVALMLIVFVRERDYRYAAIAAVVLAIIFLGFLLGLQTAAAQ